MLRHSFHTALYNFVYFPTYRTAEYCTLSQTLILLIRRADTGVPEKMWQWHYYCSTLLPHFYWGTQYLSIASLFVIQSFHSENLMRGCDNIGMFVTNY